MAPTPRKIHRLQKANSPSEPDVLGPTFLVLDISRYYPEPSFRKRLGIDACHFWDVFDLTLSDRQHQWKVVLPADERKKHKIQPGCTLRLLKIARYCEETSIDRETITVVQQLSVEQDQVEDISNLKGLPWTPSHFSRQKENIPLASFRSYFADEWTFGVDFEKLEISRASHTSISAVDLSEVWPLKDVVTKKVSQYRKPTVMVKVMRKSKLIHYITSFKEDKWPFLVQNIFRDFGLPQPEPFMFILLSLPHWNLELLSTIKSSLSLVVADRSGWCAAVLWNRLGVQCLHDIQEGSIILLHNFRVKPSVIQNQKSFFSPPQGMELFRSELSLDSHHPTTELKILDIEQDDDIDSLGFPPLETCLMTRKDLISVPDCSVVDVAGLITYVSRIEREPRKATGPQGDSGGFFYRRWIHLKDVSHDDPIILLVYAGDQKETFMGLTPGQYLLCRHVLTSQQLSDLQSSRQTRHGWLATTANSWLYIVDPANTAALPEPLGEMVKRVLPQQQQQHHKMFLQGGFFRYPPFPSSLEILKKSDSVLLEKVLPSDKWKDVFDKMTWRECHQFVVHASLVSLIYFKLEQERLSSSRSKQSPRKRHLGNDEPDKSESLQNGSSLDQVGVSQSSAISELWPTYVSGKKPKPRSAVVIKWQGLGCPTTLNTIKPCALMESADVQNFCGFMIGAFDSDLGLVQHDRPNLTQREVKALTESAKSHAGCNFVLLIDVYTNRNNQQVITLNRAYLIT